MPRWPTVYATLGTAYNRTPGIFPAILAALAHEPINLIVTLGPGHDPDNSASNRRTSTWNGICPRAASSRTIVHGGSGTARTALGHGLPMVIISIAADQPENARRCAALGLARVVPAGDCTPETIREAVRAVLQESHYRQNARRLRREMESLPGPEYAVALLERLARERQPLIARLDPSA